MMRFEALVLAAALGLAGCAGAPPVGGEGLRVTKLDALPPPNRVDLTAGERPYFIGPFDKLQIKVFGIEELSGEVQADGGARISLPLAGTIDASGRTAQEVAAEIARRLSDGYVKDPQVSVNLVESLSHFVTVDGAVIKPGLYPVSGQMTLMRAIARAEGATEFAELDDVVIFRTVDGQRLAGVYNLGAIRRGIYEDPGVYPSDVVIVGESGTKRLFRNVIERAPALLTPLVYILTQNGR